MKPNVHPMYNSLEAICACGHKFETRSTSASIHVEVCSQCHPFYTGKQKI
ncbi:MAG: 50S ribosomal protein L31, partial [Gemmatimonadota bacterium]